MNWTDSTARVICPHHGRQSLTEQQYEAAMDRPDDLWLCPKCGDPAEWDDLSDITNPPDEAEDDTVAF